MIQQEPNDAVDCYIEQWHQQGMAKDTLVAMESIGRVKRLEVLLMRKLNANYKNKYALSHWEFDVLATLRRQGSPYCLSPTALFDSMMVSSGTMTNRLKHLEEKALIERVDNPEDKRSLLVKLTQEGIKLIDDAITSHIALENDMVKGMSREELSMLNILLKKLEAQL